MCDIKELKDNLFGAKNEIIKEWRKLHDDYKKVKLKEIDVHHYMEFYNLNAAEGYKAYKLLKDILQERRQIKNKIEELQPLVELLNGSVFTDNNKISKINNQIEQKINLHNNANKLRQYRVRIMTEIFGDTMKLKKAN